MWRGQYTLDMIDLGLLFEKSLSQFFCIKLQVKRVLEIYIFLLKKVIAILMSIL